ncbi:type II toxin-antitoxin system RelE/ParE family toxin [Candidatus Acetothermia bacterium]|nr:type II toxin-antitoxin system RelE/ParE family toxin [Candidatus Acetothermia bacterium]
MISSFADKKSESIFNRERVRGMSNGLQDAILRKLRYLHNAKTLHDLRVMPGAHLEKLRGDREGQYSIRVNDQWRICFGWDDGVAFNVEAVDYH